VQGAKIRLPSKSKQEKDEADAKRKAAEQTKIKEKASVSSSPLLVEGAGQQISSVGASSTTDEGWSVVSQPSELSMPSEGDVAADGEPPAYL